MSTTDKEAVLVLARRLKIDGIVAYASDPAAPTQAYVAEEMGLVGNPYQSVLIMTRKDLFRKFLASNGFFVPRSEVSVDLEEAVVFGTELGFPLIVKPVDSSGSKGVSKITESGQMQGAFNSAMTFSQEKLVVIEHFLERDGYQVAGDGFVVDGNLVFRCWANEHFDKLCNSLVPIGESFPSVLSESLQEKAHREIQRLLRLLVVRVGALNFDFQFNSQGVLFIIEVGPRNGGNSIPEVIHHSTGIDLVKYTVDSALGIDCSSLSMKQAMGFFSSYVVHSLEDGEVEEVWLSDEIHKNIVDNNVDVRNGDLVRRFDGSDNSLGTLILTFETSGEMLYKMNNMEEHIRVILK